jgi:hypothetical protein
MKPHQSMMLLLVVPVILACGIVNTVTDKVTGGDSYMPAAQLWSDVPPMPGLGPSELDDLPLPVKLLMQTMLGNLGRVNAEGEDQTTGSVDWIAFNITGTPSNVSGFYSPEAMAASGWSPDGDQACASGSVTGLAEAGTFCTFTKTEGGKDMLLAVIATQDDPAEPTSVFFLRLETAATSQ